MSEARAYEPNITRVRTVTVIPPRLKPVPGMPTLSQRPKRVAAYARVSTNSEEQLTSYDAQVKHYTNAAARSTCWYYTPNTSDFIDLLRSVLGPVWTGEQTAE